MADDLGDQIQSIIDGRLEPLREKRRRAEEVLDAIDKEIAAEEAAVAKVLRRFGVPTPKKGPVRANKQQTTKPQADDAKATETIKGIVAQNPGVPVDDMLALTKDQLSDEGFDLRGFTKKRFTKLVSDGPFQVQGGKINLGGGAA